MDLYNNFMIYYINFFVSSFVLDFFTGVLLKKIFKLSANKIEIFFLQIFNLAPVILYLFDVVGFYLFFLMKILSNFVVCLLITDSFKISNISKLFVFNLFLSFSIFGFCKFFTLLLNVVSNNYFIVVQFPFRSILIPHAAGSRISPIAESSAKNSSVI